jgi:hypothetical protein
LYDNLESDTTGLFTRHETAHIQLIGITYQQAAWAKGKRQDFSFLHRWLRLCGE